jgi:hypothetical protein
MSKDCQKDTNLSKWTKIYINNNNRTPTISNFGHYRPHFNAHRDVSVLQFNRLISINLDNNWKLLYIIYMIAYLQCHDLFLSC